MLNATIAKQMNGRLVDRAMKVHAIVNPISAIAPGLLRKLFEFRDTSERGFEPQR